MDRQRDDQLQQRRQRRQQQHWLGSVGGSVSGIRGGRQLGWRRAAGGEGGGVGGGGDGRRRREEGSSRRTGPGRQTDEAEEDRVAKGKEDIDEEYEEDHVEYIGRSNMRRVGGWVGWGNTS